MTTTANLSRSFSAGDAVPSTALLAGYVAARPNNTTRQGSRWGSNPNSTIASLQRVAMNWTAEDVFKNSALGAAYILQRVNYCSALMAYIPATGDTGLDAELKAYLSGDDGCSGVFGSMGVDCSMQDAVSRTADIECPIRGDAGMIILDWGGEFRLVEFSADQLGEIYNFTMARQCGLSRKSTGELYETNGSDVTYLSGRYYRGPDCVAYKIYERTNAWYANPRIYDAADVIYFRDPSSFRGVRGVTKFATAIQHMEKGEALWQTGMDIALRQARTFGRVFNEQGQSQELSYEAGQYPDGRVTFFEKVPSGPIEEYYFNGDSAEFTNPTAPGQSVIDGVETSDERVALALALNYAFLISATKVGGAPSRLEINKAAKEFQRIQNRIIRPGLSRIGKVTILSAVRRGIFPPKANITRGRWVLPISPSVDAFYDAQENIKMARAGFEAPQDIIAETNRDADDVLEKSKQWAIKCAMKVEDANNELVRLGYKPTITAADIAQVSDNPQQTAQAEALVEGKPTTITDAKTKSESVNVEPTR